MDEKERAWLDEASMRGGSFVETFANCCFAADNENFKILRPILAMFMEKYPSYSKNIDETICPGCESGYHTLPCVISEKKI